MKRYFQKTLFLTFFLGFIQISNATILLVENLANSGSKSLRDEINAASFNDTILINIKGNIVLLSPLLIDKSIVIIGATASHTTIDVNGNYLDVNGPNLNVFINDLRIINGAGGINPTTLIQGSANLNFKNVLFENINSSGNGAAIRNMASGTISTENCSFFNNTTSQNGGAIFISSVGAASIRNCTFFNNTANHGGAIQNEGSALLVNNTFLNNTSTAGLAQGHAVNDGNNSAGSLTRIQNNIFADPSTLKHPKLISGSILDMWQTDGGNIYPDNNLIFDFIPGGGVNDRFNEAFGNLFLRANAITDGYGLKYYTITNQTSTAIDNGTSGVNVANNDCRRAPRILFGDSGLNPDAGAVEFTPFTSTSNISATFSSIWNAMNGSGFTGPKYMDFDISGGGPVNYNLSTSLNNNTSASIDWIVDGFTQEGSIVAGPGVLPNSYTAATYMVNINNNSTDVILLNDPGFYSSISGLSLNNGTGTVAIRVINGFIHIYGNHIISITSTGSSGVILNTCSGGKIGGSLHYFRNVISSQSNYGVHVVNMNSTIEGNFIGTNSTGLATLPNGTGILVDGGFSEIQGKYRFPSMNVVSGNISSQIEISTLSNFEIKGNIIGPDVSGNNLLTTTAKGIHLNPNTGGKIGGLDMGDLNVIGGNTEGIYLNTSDLVEIYQNFIGLSADPSLAYQSIPNVTGISIINNGDFNHFIGNGTIQGRNYICNNSSMGIYLENGTNHDIRGNFIGVKPDNGVAGNATRGIHLVGGTTQGNQILGNIIGGHSVAGIDVNGAGGAGNISGNKIGTDSTGLLFRPNGRGIQIDATPSGSQIIGNLISGNTTDGVFLDNSPTTVQDNIIGLNLDTTAVLANGGQGLQLLNTNNSVILDNYISGNGANGIFIGAGGNNSIRGNHIGTNRVGANFGNQSNGIALFFAGNNNMIGGTAVVDYNEIMFNVGAGIDVEREHSVTGIRGNYFANNNVKAILLNTQTPATTPLANDVNDADVSGAAMANVGNNGQNYPIVNSAIINAGVCTVTGTLNVSNPTGNYLIQVYKVNPANIDASGHGEGDTLMANQVFNAGSMSTFNFNINVPSVVIGDVLSLTASRQVGGFYETSEFSDTIMTRAPFNVDVIDSTDVTCNGAADGRLEVLATGSANLPYLYQWHNSGGPIAGATSSVYFGGPETYFCVVTDAAAVTINSDTVTISQPPVLTAGTNAPINPTCNGTCDGSIVVNGTGGTSPYQYSINNGTTYQTSNTFSSLCAGIYQFRVQDANGCQTTNTGNNVSLTNPPLLSISPVVTDETCDGLNDGTISLSGIGGTSPYDFQVDGIGFTSTSFYSGLAPGNHTIDVRDANGCISGGNVNILGGEVVTANFSFNNACEDLFAVNVSDLSTAASGIASWNYTFTGASPSSATIANVSNIMFFTPGANNIQLTVVSNDGCSDVINQNVTIYPNPIVNAGLDDAICFGDPYTQNASVLSGTSPFSFSWLPNPSFVNPNIEDAVITSTLSNSTGTFTHILNVLDANGCEDADTMILTINSLPTVTAPSDYSVCSGSPTTLSGTGTAISYTWNNSVIDGTSFNPTATATYTVTGTDGNGCQNIDNVTITVDTPYSLFAGFDFNVCETTTSFSLSGSTNATFGNYFWTQLNGSGSLIGASSLTPTYNLVAPDTLQNTLEFIFQTNASGSCPPSEDTVVVVLIDPPTVSAIADFSICSSAGTAAISASTSDVNNVNWISSGSGTFNPTSTTPSTNYDFSALDISNGTVTLTVTGTATNGVCANASDALTITILTSPIAVAGTDGTICVGQAYTLDGNASSGTITTFQWDVVGGSTISNSVTTNVNPSVSTDYALTVDNGICVDYDTLSLNVIAGPDASFTYPQTAYCQNASPSSPNPVTNGGTYSMPGSPGNINTTSGTITFTTLGPGTYDIYYTLTTPCTAVDSFQITVNALPDATVNGPFQVCEGVSSFNLNTVFNPITTGGTWSGSNVTDPNFDPFAAGPGTFSPAYTVTDANGCTNTDTAKVVVIASPVVSITGVNGNYCITDGLIIPIGTPLGGVWSLDATGFGPLSSIDLSVIGSGFHTLSYQFTDVTTGCVGTTIPPIGFNVSAMPLDPIAVSNTTQTICAGNSVLLTVSNPNTGPTIQWYDDVALTNNVGSSVNFNTPILTSSTTYYAVAENVSCTSGAVVFNIIVNNAAVSAGPDLTICPGTPAQLNVTSVSGTILWSPGSTLDDSTIANPLATPNVNTTYLVTVTSGPCSATDSITVYIDGSNPNCGIFPSYNAFSPDGDGVNDTWIVDAIFNHPDNTVTIFNRWGDKLVSFDDYDNVNIVWDGTYKGNILPSGTYFYVIEYLDIQQQVSGWLQLTR